MKANVGKNDKLIRLLLALIGILLYVFNVVHGTFGIVILVIAALLIITSLINFCPLYAVLGMNTCKSQEKK